uniref:Secreted protein n=1 Tax=Chrysemys picta bellii TaxID=8478 RepID=A0A8C3PG87_CHRPI
MCTTLLVISTLAILLRRHFFNRVEPYVLPHLSLPCGGEGRGRGSWLFLRGPAAPALSSMLEMYGSAATRDSGYRYCSAPYLRLWVVSN